MVSEPLCACSGQLGRPGFHGTSLEGFDLGDFRTRLVVRVNRPGSANHEFLDLRRARVLVAFSCERERNGLLIHGRSPFWDSHTTSFGGSE